MRTDPIARFVQLHRQLSNEKRHLEERLARINRALSSLDAPRTGRAANPPKRPLQNPVFRLKHKFRLN